MQKAFAFLHEIRRGVQDCVVTSWNSLDKCGNLIMELFESRTTFGDFYFACCSYDIHLNRAWVHIFRD